MEIKGPIRVGVVEDPQGLGYELELEFTEAFRALELAERGPAFAAFVESLRTAADNAQQARERQGMLTILQIAEGLASAVAGDEIPLEEPIRVEIRPEGLPVDLLSNHLH